MSVNGPDSISACEGWIEVGRSVSVPAGAAAGTAIQTLTDLNTDAPAMTFTNGTGANQALYQTDVLAHVSFDGISDFYDTAGPITFTGGFAIAMIVRTDAVATNQIFVGHSANGNKVGIVGSSWFIRTVDLAASNNAIAYAGGTDWTYIIYARDAADAVTLQVDGATATAVNTQAGNSIWERIGSDGGGLFMPGDIAFAAFFDGALTAAQATDVNDYMRWLLNRDRQASGWQWEGRRTG